jgi:methionyl-tRNA formyltransferase
MRLVFMGTPFFAVPVLEELVRAGHQVMCVVTQPDRPRGRNLKMQSPPVKEAALNLGLPVWQPEKPGDPDFLAVLGNLFPDAVIVAAYGRILPPAVLRLPRYGCINVHASLLPKYRGAAPIHRAIINGEKETGITTMMMDEGLDTGDILLQEAVPIAEEDTAGTLHDRLAKLGAEVLVKTLELLAAGKLTPRPQDHALATYAPALSRADEEIDWGASARDVYNRVRGLAPWPGAATLWAGRVLKIWRVTVASGESLLAGTLPGQVRVASPAEGLLVQANPGLVAVEELQVQGGRKMGAGEFLRGHPILPGTFFGV